MTEISVSRRADRQPADRVRREACPATAADTPSEAGRGTKAVAAPARKWSRRGALAVFILAYATVLGVTFGAFFVAPEPAGQSQATRQFLAALRNH